MTENHDIPAATLKIIDDTLGFSILFCNYEFIRKNTKRTRARSPFCTPPRVLYGFPIAARLHPAPFPGHFRNASSLLTELHFSKMTTRTESDTMGEKQVPQSVYWGAQTARSIHFFNIGHDVMPRPVIRAMGILKKACALVNAELKPAKMTQEKLTLICSAADEVIAGKLDAHFPVHILDNEEQFW